MRAVGLAIIAIQIGLVVPAHAENTEDPDRSITDVLPLFVKNRYHDFASSFGLLGCQPRKRKDITGLRRVEPTHLA